MKFRVLLLALAIVLAAAAPARAQLWKGQVGDIDALEKGAAAGDPEKTAEYAWHLLEGQGGRRFDAKQIFKLFEAAAAKGSPLGQIGLSRCYARGIGTKADMRESWKYLDLAAKTEHPEAWKQMGYMYIGGYGVVRDLERGRELTAKAAEAGSIGAQINHVVDRGRRNDDYTGDSDAHLQIAFRTGNLLAAYNAVYGFRTRCGVPAAFENNRKLIALFEDRAKLEHPEALLGLAFVRGCQGDWEACRSLVMRAAQTGCLSGIQKLQLEANLTGFEKTGLLSTYYATTSGRNGLNWYAYSLGNHEDRWVSLAGQAVAVGFEGHPSDPAAAVKLLAKHLPGKEKSLHYDLALLSRPLIEKDKSGKTGQLAIAHAIYASDENPGAIGMLAFLLSGQQPGIPADLVRVQAAVAAAEEDDPIRPWAAKILDGKLSDEQKKQADELIKKGYPKAKEYIEAAAKELKEAKQFAGTSE